MGPINVKISKTFSVKTTEVTMSNRFIALFIFFLNLAFILELFTLQRTVKIQFLHPFYTSLFRNYKQTEI